MTDAEWREKGAALFGPDLMEWRFVCPACGHVQCAQDYKDAGAPSGAVATSCVGRWLPGSRKAFGGDGPGPCNYAGFGLFRLNLVDVDGQRIFTFAEASVP